MLAFRGGARTGRAQLISELSQRGHAQSVCIYSDEVDRGTEGMQRIEDDASFRRISATRNAQVHRLGINRDPSATNNKIIPFTLSTSGECPAGLLENCLSIHRSDVVLSLKEQPVDLLIHANQRLHSTGRSPVPIVISLHRTDPEDQDSRTFNQLREIVQNPVTGRFVAGFISCARSAIPVYRDGLGLTDDHFAFVPNGIDLSLFTERNNRLGNNQEFLRLLFRQNSEDLVKPDANTVLFGARFSREKNIGLFLQAACILLQRNPSAQVLLCGQGMTPSNLTEPLASAANEVGVSS